MMTVVSRIAAGFSLGLVALLPLQAQGGLDRFLDPPDTRVYRGCIADVSCHTFEFFLGRIAPTLTSYGVVDRAYAWRLTTTAERPVNIGNRWWAKNHTELAAYTQDTGDDYSLFGNSACNYNADYDFCVGTFTEDFALRSHGPLALRPSAAAPERIHIGVSWLPDGPAERRNLIFEDPNIQILSSSVELVFVPEPGTSSLAALSIVALATRRRRVVGDRRK